MKTFIILPFILCSLFFTSCTGDEVVAPTFTIEKSMPFVYYQKQMDGEIKFELTGQEIINLNEADASHIKIENSSEAILTEDNFVKATYTLEEKIPEDFDSMRIYVGSSHHYFWTEKIDIQIGSESFIVTAKELDETMRLVVDTTVADTWNNPGGSVENFPIVMSGVNLIGSNVNCGGHSYTYLRLIGGLAKHHGKTIRIVLSGTIDKKNKNFSIGAFGGEASFIPLSNSGKKIGYDANPRQRKHLLYKFAEKPKDEV